MNYEKWKVLHIHELIDVVEIRVIRVWKIINFNSNPYFWRFSKEYNFEMRFYKNQIFLLQNSIKWSSNVATGYDYIITLYLNVIFKNPNDMVSQIPTHTHFQNWLILLLWRRNISLTLKNYSRVIQRRIRYLRNGNIESTIFELRPLLLTWEIR